MELFEPVCREIVSGLVQSALAKPRVELMADLALPFAVSVQCAFMGWPRSWHERLAQWIKENHEATLAQDRPSMSALAREFAGFIDEMIESRAREYAEPGQDNTAALMHEQVWGGPLSNEEIASIVRNWTAGEVGTIASAVGILADFLARNRTLQEQLRAQPAILAAANDEILRLHGPLVANRRITTRPVTIGGRMLAAGERISLMWLAGNRDPRIFNEPHVFRLDPDSSKNLLYGSGIHVCPGAPLARMELRVAMEELLGATRDLRPVPAHPPTLAVYPASAFARLPIQLES